jgi:uncharacterized secreted protein with C-terminal beta-propeller domain
VQRSPVDSVLPNFTTFGGHDDIAYAGPISEATDVYCPVGQEFSDLISVVTINAGDAEAGPVSSVTMGASEATQIYMATDSLYLFGKTYDDAGKRTTEILKLAIDAANGSVKPTARGQVPGFLVNRFSVDEHDGNLRITTSNGRWRSFKTQLFVLTQSGELLKITSRIEGLASAEKYFATRRLNPHRARRSSGDDLVMEDTNGIDNGLDTSPNDPRTKPTTLSRIDDFDGIPPSVSLAPEGLTWTQILEEDETAPW